MTTTPRQARRLAAQLAHAQRSIPMYRDLWSAHGIDVRELRIPDELHRVPLLTKDHLRAASLEARTDPRFAGARLSRTSTSGSTGQPLALATDAATRRRRQWRFLRGLLAAGYRPGQRLMLVSSRSERSIRKVSPFARLFGWHYVDLYDGADAMLRAYETLRPQAIYAPLQALTLLGSALEESACRHRPARVISTSEQLLPSAHARLATQFGTTVTDFYGSTEVGLVAWRLADAAGYDFVPDSFHIEFLPSAGEPIGLERLVVTELHGGALPFFRYDTGDLVRRSAQGEVTEIAGKQLDFLQLPDGGLVSPYLVDRILGEQPGIAAYRVVQQADLALDVSAVTSDPAALDSAGEALRGLCRNLLPLTIRRLDSLAVAGHKARPIQSFAARNP